RGPTCRAGTAPAPARRTPRPAAGTTGSAACLATPCPSRGTRRVRPPSSTPIPAGRAGAIAFVFEVEVEDPHAGPAQELERLDLPPGGRPDPPPRAGRLPVEAAVAEPLGRGPALAIGHDQAELRGHQQVLADPVRRPFGDLAPPLQHDHAIRQLPDLAGPVRAEEQRLAGRLEPLEQLAEFLAGPRVEVDGRLFHQH